MSNVIGIDLGTSFSVVSTLDHTGRPVIVHNKNGQNMTPSVVSFEEDGTTEVGSGARLQLQAGDPNTVGGFKRDMGTDITYPVHNQNLSPIQLSALVLTKLKEDTEEILGDIDETVITIPANFGDKARSATMEAAQLAGLPTRFIINEPTAAALYYAHEQEESLNGIHVVYDLGGGTFDVSVIRVVDYDIEILATNGVAKLGGDDFDEVLRTVMKKEFEKGSGGVLLDDSVYTKQDAEEDKISLSTRERKRRRVSSGGHTELIELTRQMFEEGISSMITQTVMLGEATMVEAGVTPQEIKEVFLAGGSTRIPAVQASVERTYGRSPKTSANVDEVVSLGASLYAAYKGESGLLNPLQRRAIEKINVTERTSKSYGLISYITDENTKRQELANSTMIPRNTVIPASVVEMFYTTHDGQTMVECQVTEAGQAERDPRFVDIIGKGELPLPEGRPSGQEVRVTFEYNVNQMMICSFEDVETGKTTEVEIHMASHSNDETSPIERFKVV